MSEALRVDLVVTWAAAAAALTVLGQMARKRSRSLLEARSMVLLAVLGLLCLVRGFYWLGIGGPGLRLLTFVAAAVVPLALALFVEGLLRRHLPLWMKVLAAGVSAIAFLVALLAMPRTLAAAPFGVAVVVVMACLCVALLRRDRQRLSPAENDLVVACIAVALLAVPLAATDFRAIGGAAPTRLGGIAVLAFVYVLVRAAFGRNRPVRLLWDASWRVFQALLLAGVVLLLTGVGGPSHWVRAFSAALALVLLFEVWERVTHVIVVRDDRALLRWLTHARLTSLGAFLNGLERYPLTEEHVLLQEGDLRAYSLAALVRAFPGSVPVCSAAQLRHVAAAGQGEELDAAEQMLDVLNKYEMTHACLLGTEPTRILLVNLPDVAGNEDAELELQVIQHVGNLAVTLEKHCA